MSSNRDMIQRPGLLPISVFLVAGSVFGQIGFPGISRTSTKNPVTTVNGVLRGITDDDLVLQTDDKVIMKVALGITTKYYKASGAMIKAAELQPGDRINIDATQDDHGYFHAKSVNQVKAGTPSERAAASQPVETSPVAGGPVSGNASGGRSPRDDSAVVAGPPDPNDPGPPALKRGAARRTASSSGSGAPSIAENDPPSASRPSIHAGELNGVTRTPDAPKVNASDRVTFPQSGDPVIDKAREAAFTFSETLPNFVVKQVTVRYETFSARGGQTAWHAIDTVTADVVSEDGKESYKSILINGKPPKEAIEKNGSWSTGEFSSIQLDVLSSGTRANFHNRQPTTIANRAAYRYDFSVERANSHWNIHSNSEALAPEYAGVIWIDKDNSRVLRIELSARNIPGTFRLDTVESAVDYDYVLIGDGKFLLPVHSEALSCERGTNFCSRNVIDFRDYKKFTADTSISFDDAAQDK
jgi:hypothetical protein